MWEKKHADDNQLLAVQKRRLEVCMGECPGSGLRFVKLISQRPCTFSLLRRSFYAPSCPCSVFHFPYRPFCFFSRLFDGICCSRGERKHFNFLDAWLRHVPSFFGEFFCYFIVIGSFRRLNRFDRS
jgi:hypothetical protein